PRGPAGARGHRGRLCKPDAAHGVHGDGHRAPPWADADAEGGTARDRSRSLGGAQALRGRGALPGRVPGVGARSIHVRAAAGGGWAERARPRPPGHARDRGRSCRQEGAGGLAQGHHPAPDLEPARLRRPRLPRPSRPAAVLLEHPRLQGPGAGAPDAHERRLALCRRADRVHRAPVQVVGSRGGQRRRAAMSKRWDELVEGGRTAARKQQYDSAESHYREALREAEVLGEEEPETVIPIRISLTLEHMAELYAMSSRREAAVKTFEQVLALREQHLGPLHRKVAKTLFDLGDLYLALGRYADAERCYRRSLTVAEHVLGKDDPEVGTV